jgi:hypothetical protein
MNTINKDELLKSSKWIRFLFMVIYSCLAYFVALPITFGLAFIQFLFVLFSSKENSSISNISIYVIEFFNDSLAFLLFHTEDKPFPFKNNDMQEEVIEAEINEVEEEVSEDISEYEEGVKESYGAKREPEGN